MEDQEYTCRRNNDSSLENYVQTELEIALF